MKHAVSQELFQYWSSVRGARNAPERGDLDPAMIRGILADTFVLEVVARVASLNRSFPVRLSGTRVNALFLDELKQRCFLTLWRIDDRGSVEDVLNNVLDEQAATVAGVRAAPPNGVDLDLELLLLPLRHHGQTHRRILGSLAPFRVPSWFGVQSVEHLGLRSMRAIDRSQGPLSGLLRPAEAQPEKPVRRGRFMVHDGGR